MLQIPLWQFTLKFLKHDLPKSTHKYCSSFVSVDALPGRFACLIQFVLWEQTSVNAFSYYYYYFFFFEEFSPDISNSPLAIHLEISETGFNERRNKYCGPFNSVNAPPRSFPSVSFGLLWERTGVNFLRYLFLPNVPCSLEKLRR